MADRPQAVMEMRIRDVGGIRVHEWNPDTFSCASCGTTESGYAEGPDGWRLGLTRAQDVCGGCDRAGEGVRYQGSRRRSEHFGTSRPAAAAGTESSRRGRGGEKG